MGDTFGYGQQSLYGFYTWDIAEDAIWGDAKFAQIAGLDEAALNAGVSILNYMDIVHQDDRAKVAEATRNAVLSGQPYMLICRLLRGDDVITVRDRGACFRYRDGLPSLATGTLEILQVEHGKLPAANQEATGQTQALLETGKESSRTAGQSVVIEANFPAREDAGT